MNTVPSSTYFSAPPEWGWLITFYFFFGGLAGGCYFLAALIDLLGRPEDRPLARLGYYISFPCVVLSGLLLTLDLGRPERYLAYAHRVEHVSTHVQTLVADVAGLLGAVDLWNIRVPILSGSARRRQPYQLAASAQDSSAGNFEPGHCRYRRDLWPLRRRLHGSSPGRDKPPHLVGHPSFRYAVCCFGGFGLGGIDDSRCASIRMDHARCGGPTPHRCVGRRIGIDCSDRRHNISGTRISSLAQRLGPVALFRCHRSSEC